MNRTVNILVESHDYYRLNKKRIWMLGAALLCVLILFSVLFITKTVTAQRNVDRAKLVTSIEVKKGDSLWSIASEFMTDEYDDMNEYIKEIKDSNGMDSDDIHVGNFIIVPYYVDASR
ncbi:MAG: hypothetical protein K0S01_3537 [Herbinix sp.]|jgi:hypothetical protein|nr:hypothetical protein [Herbinix sp.]